MVRGDTDNASNDISIWRILGNDLPPRHALGQTRNNLSFILENEPESLNPLRRWVVNRIVDPDEEARILELLRKHQQYYIHIPFQHDEYVLWTTRQGFGAVKSFDELTDSRSARHLKCLFIMNVNAARNLALREGRKIARWILPLDGNCCFTEDGWNQVSTGLSEREANTDCLAIPMYRLMINQQFFGFSPQGPSLQEPQLAFSRNCREEFDPSYRYGFKSKVELLRRLGFAFRKRDAHEVTDTERLCGYVVRLQSGVPALDGHWRMRHRLREIAIDRLIARVDASVY